MHTHTHTHAYNQTNTYDIQLKATVEELKKSVQKSHKSVEELVKRMDNEGANFDETLVKVDQVSDHIAGRM